MIRVSLLLVIFLSFAIVSFSVYEDQVDRPHGLHRQLCNTSITIEMRSVVLCMHQRFIGKVKHAVFHTQKTGRKRVIVSTEENVVASLDLRLGDIFWRHVLGTKDAIDGVDIALEKYVITLSSQGSMLRAWNLPDGQMVWETSLHRAQHSKSLLFLVPEKAFTITMVKSIACHTTKIVRVEIKKRLDDRWCYVGGLAETNKDEWKL
ncbi:hypothetical protein DY000_02000479 [Brassica cretica]|uniref:EMC1 first beta-propeller domain-containing protein n=1 Tax=Brassica cretica TaxID=69181 RepID=A0ABQ7CBS0_BRACR|nr:hypothetical protein DY000_02000479 [Brassica cretica]